MAISQCVMLHEDFVDSCFESEGYSPENVRELIIHGSRIFRYSIDRYVGLLDWFVMVGHGYSESF